ncbi:1,4-alpha-glucan branching protein GlgB [Novisyntrophococcus fermenticellae]|uniref:1,4-alpha-glucan branching protein GlgB n=1 Tax=Novisyntrophococcus fermenticellae TaxID=2068655 RepID=UPI001E3AE3FA|nr:1,4-alpha-glucan branching protein GlgB [Novisyntrophococcus fermenticellae]
MDKLYDLMDWASIEAVVYSEEDHPKRILGSHVTKDGVIIQCFFPGTEKVSVRTLKDDCLYEMEMEDEAGYFALLLEGDSIPKYVYVLEDGQNTKEVYDPYVFPGIITEKEEKQFQAGICYRIYEKLGAHPMCLQGVWGTCFAVWAPNALRVSVTGDFNGWDGRIHQMERLDHSGIFELFIPGVGPEDLYKYEIKAKGGLTYLKADPYANAAENRPGTASVVTDLKYQWADREWMTGRRKIQSENQPIFIYEVHLGSWRVPEDREDKYFYNYRELAPMLAGYIKEMGYTHVELMPVMEHPLDESWGYQVTGYYAPTARYGTPEDFMYFMDYMHQQGIGVILDWVPAHFPRDTFAMSAFDGTCLYEHLDPKQGAHPHWGTLIYNYGRPEVRNFLISNALFWAEKYHADGIRMDAVASMLYLDYGKNDGEWVANIYGGNENLEAVEFLKQLNSIFKKKYPDALLIAEESTAWPKVTGEAAEEGLGFDYKWNMGWMHDFTGYMSYDPVHRGAHHDELTFSMVYAYSERFCLSLSHDEVVHGKASLLEKMPGDEDQKFANLRAALGYMTVHPGKKLLFMGQDIGQHREWSESRGLDWPVLEEEKNRLMKNYVQSLLHMYREQKALYELDFDANGFEWINSLEWEKNLLIFLRKGKKMEDTLLVVCNFSGQEYEKYQIGVPYPGKYKEIFNSDNQSFGGTGFVNPRVKFSKPEECDERKNSITINIAPLCVSLLHYTKAVKKLADNKAAKKKTPITAPSKRKVDLKKELQDKIEKEEAKR